MITQERLEEVIREAEDGYNVSPQDFLAAREYYVGRIKEKEERIKNSYVRNCYLEPRPGDSPLFNGDNYAARLDGYAIIPRERYQHLLWAEALVGPVKS